MTFLGLLIATVSAASPGPVNPCEAAASSSLTEPAPNHVVGYLGVSDRELGELVSRGRVGDRTLKFRPRVIEGTSAFERFRADKRRFQYDVADAREQVRQANLDAWSRSILDALNARYPEANFWSPAALGFAHALVGDLDQFPNFSPGGARIRRAAEASNLPQARMNGLRRLRTLAKMMNLPWALELEDSGPVLRAIEAEFANLSSAGGAVLYLASPALDKMSWQVRNEVHLKAIDLADVVKIDSSSPI